MEKKTERYNSLDGLRTIMCILIVAMHVLTNIGTKPPSNCIITIISYAGNFTLLFMIVSAFSMCCGYYTKFKSKNIDLNNFYKKRYTRILPFYILLLLITILVEPTINNFYEAFTCITLTQSLLPNNCISVVGVGWFLSVVFVFYMMFPFFIFLIDNRKRAWIILTIVVLLNFLCVYYYSSPDLVVKKISRLNFIFDLPYFVMGGILYLYREDIRLLGKYKIIFRLFTICISIVFFIIKWDSYYIYFFVEMFFFICLMIYAIMESDRSMLNNKFMNFISNISMEIYLCHMLCFRIADKECCNISLNANYKYIIILVLTLLSSICFAYSFKCLEHFFINRTKLFSFMK